jgi:hypothetical protein
MYKCLQADNVVIPEVAGSMERDGFCRQLVADTVAAVTSAAIIAPIITATDR